MNDEPDRVAINSPGLTRVSSFARTSVQALSWSPDGTRLAVLSAGNTLAIHAADTGLELNSVVVGSDDPESQDIANVSWAATEEVVGFSGSHMHGVWQPHLASAEIVHSEWSTDTHAIDPSGRWLTIGGYSAWTLRLDTESHEVLWEREGFAWFCGDRAGSTLAGISGDRLQLLDAVSGETTVEATNGGINGKMTISPLGDLLAGCVDSSIRIVDCATGEASVLLEGHERPVVGLTFSIDGSSLISWDVDEIRIWRTSDWRNVIVSRTHSLSYGRGDTIAANPADPSKFATAGSDEVTIYSIDLSEIDANLVDQQFLYTTARVALVGDSGVGKTSLGWRLVFDEFVEHGSTHGQQFWTVDSLQRKRDDGASCDVILWDLAGQPDYRIVHALFVSDADAALLLFDSTRREGPLEGVDYWIKALTSERQLCPSILVGSRVDRGTPTLADDDIAAYCEYHNIEGGYVSTSATEGRGIDELTARLSEIIPWDDLPPTITTTVFKSIRDYVLGLKATAGADVLMSLEALAERFAGDVDGTVSREAHAAAVEHLERHGYLSTIVASSGDMYVLLAPELLTNLASSIVLEARANPEGLGALDEPRVRALGYSFPELDGLAAPAPTVLVDEAIRLFLASNLCFREVLGNSRLLVFPALINEKRPPTSEIELKHDDTYAVSGAVENVYSALVVLLGYTNTFTQQHRWKDNARYQLDADEVCGFEQVAAPSGEIELVLHFAETARDSTRNLFRGLFERFLLQRDVSVVRYPAVVCACGYLQDRTSVIRRIAEAREHLYCGECGERIVLPSGSERLAISMTPEVELGASQAQGRSRYEAALVRVQRLADQRGSFPASCFISYAWGDEEHERWVERLALDLTNAGISVLFDKWHNVTVGARVGRFVAQMAEQDYVLVIGTPEALQKSENSDPGRANILAAERDLFEQRLTGTERAKDSVLPLLRAGDSDSSFPPLLRGKVYSDCRTGSDYFGSLFDLVLSILGIPFDDPAVQDLRAGLHPNQR